MNQEYNGLYIYNLQEVAAESINQYGVGSCGPRGFYGTVGEYGLYFFLII